MGLALIFLTLSYFSEETTSELGFEVQAGVYQVDERGKNTGQTGCRAEARRRGTLREMGAGQFDSAALLGVGS